MRLSERQLERFLDKIKLGRKGECWIWFRAKTTKGYGHLTLNKQDFQAHRVSYELFRGTIPVGLCVLHKCDVKQCVNPDHLFIGTIADNNADKLRKNRQPCGESSGSARLCDSEIHEIRRQACNKATTYTAIANRFGVSGSHISNIVKRKKWKHI